jgi:plastocyanin domain-containing protein
MFASCKKEAPAAPADGRPEIKVTVDGKGYTPPKVQAASNKPVRLVFTRTSDEGCGQQLVFPTLNIRKDLPLNEAVPVDITMPASGEVTFTCGMDMYRGSVVVQ